MNDTLDPVQQRQKERLERLAAQLVVQAKACGFNVEIVPRPLQPLAMRNYEMAITVWPARS